VAVNDLLFNYRAGELHNTSALLELVTDTVTHQFPITVNVRDATVATVFPQTAAPGVQIATHVVNIRADSLLLGARVAPSIIRTFYQHFGDEYDFISVLGQVQTDTGFHYLAVRNDVSGLGLQTFVRTENYGTNNLDGILHFPNDALFDPAETSVLHELAHRWLAFSNLNSIRNSRPHFPISTMARGITGFHGVDPVTQQPHVFRYALSPNPDQTWSVTPQSERPRTFNDLELYLMGLLPADSVQPHVVFLDQDQLDQLRIGGVLSGPTDTVTMADWTARDGARTPAYPNAQRTFRMATIVLSRGRLLTREELAFYNTMAMRAESEVELPAILETTRFTTLPFFLATGGRGRLITRIGPDT
jgi:hypothetical protein